MTIKLNCFAKNARNDTKIASLLVLFIFTTSSAFSDELKDIREPVAYPSSYIGIIVLACIALAVLIGFCVYWFRKRIKKGGSSAVPLASWEIALRELNKLQQKNLLAQGLADLYYYELSGILRRYIEQRFFIKAPEMTTDEFMVYIKESNVLEKKHMEQLKAFLVLADLVKFAKYSISREDAVKSFNEVFSFVEQTKVTAPQDK